MISGGICAWTRQHLTGWETNAVNHLFVCLHFPVTMLELGSGVCCSCGSSSRILDLVLARVGSLLVMTSQAVAIGEMVPDCWWCKWIFFIKFLALHPPPSVYMLFSPNPPYQKEIKQCLYNIFVTIHHFLIVTLTCESDQARLVTCDHNHTIQM